MVFLPKKFNAGDKVFAKVRGYPPWPAKIENVTEPNTKQAKYSVFFYGTGETAVCKVDELYSYAENKHKMMKPIKRKFFHEGVLQLEQELKREKSRNTAEDKDPLALEEELSTKEADTSAELPAASTTDSDAETGTLVIDERDKKKSIKRKSTIPTASSSSDMPEMKRKRGKKSLSTPEPHKQNAGTDSQSEDSPKEVISRSGRKIKPKRFADFSSSEETELSSEYGGRGRSKTKVEDSNEHVSPTLIHKKRAAMEKKNNIGDDQSQEDNVISTAAASDTPGRSVLARTFAGEYVGIKLDVDRPKTFESEKARAQWDLSTARNAMKLKAKLESGEILPEQVKDQLDFNVNVPEEEKRSMTKDSAPHQKKYKLRWLRIEARLLQLDAQIKSNLGLDRANTDKCLEAMDEMLKLPIDPLMLKKHPHIVETVKRLRRYVGNLADWKMNEDEEVEFKQKAEQIRQKAENIYNKFEAMFTIPEGQSFWQSFSDQVVHFKELTKDMPEEKVFSLMSDPSCSEVTPAEESSVDTNANQTEKETENTELPTEKESEEVPVKKEVV